MPESPYSRLKKQAKEYVNKWTNRRHREMWFYPKARMASDSWSMAELWERVAAARQLGWSVELIASDDGLHVRYVEDPVLPMPYLLIG